MIYISLHTYHIKHHFIYPMLYPFTAHMTKTENRDPHDTYNKLTMEGLIRNGDGAFDFGSYFAAATGKAVEGEKFANRI